MNDAQIGSNDLRLLFFGGRYWGHIGLESMSLTFQEQLIFQQSAFFSLSDSEEQFPGDDLRKASEMKARDYSRLTRSAFRPIYLHGQAARTLQPKEWFLLRSVFGPRITRQFLRNLPDTGTPLHAHTETLSRHEGCNLWVFVSAYSIASSPSRI